MMLRINGCITQPFQERVCALCFVCKAQLDYSSDFRAQGAKSEPNKGADNSSRGAAQRLRERSNTTILEDGIFQQIIKRDCISTIPLNLTGGNTSESGCNLVRPQPFLVLFRADERERLRIRSHSKCSNKSPAPVSSPTSLDTKP